MLTDHVIVCGLGNVGFRAVELLLALGERVSVVTAKTRESWLRHVQEKGVPVVIGDARDQKLLLEVGLQSAKSLIAITDDDLTNIEIVLDARRVRPDLPAVVRLFDQTLAGRLEGVLDIRRAVGVSGLSAPVFAAAALGERVIGSFSLDGTPYVIGRYQMEAEGGTLGEFAAQHRLFPISVRGKSGTFGEPSPEARLEPEDRVIMLAAKADWDRLIGEDAPPRRPLWRRLFELLRPTLWWSFLSNVWRNAPLSLRSVFVVFNLVLLLSVGVFHLWMHLSLRDAFYLVVSTVTTVGYGDVVPTPGLRMFACAVMLLGSLATGILYSILTDFVVAARFSQLLGDSSRVPEAGHVIVVGTGSIGFRIVEALRSTKAPTVVIDKSAEGRFMEAVRSLVPVLIGDARQDAVLRRARIESARTLIAATSDDAVNLGVGLAARKLNPNIRVVARFFDSDFARKVQDSLAIDAAISPFRIASPSFVAASLYPDARDAFVLERRLYVMLARTVTPEWDGFTAREVLSRHHVRILLRRDGAAPETPLRQGERVLAVLIRALV